MGGGLALQVQRGTRHNERLPEWVVLELLQVSAKGIKPNANVVIYK
jgi:hypothetical protein